MRYLILILFLFSLSCKRTEKKSLHEESHFKDADNKIHGVWESYLIKSREANPPKKITIKFTTYNNTKLVWMQLISEGANGIKIDKTIRVAFEEKEGKTYLVPALKKEITDTKENDDRFIRYDPQHLEIVKGLSWLYQLSEDNLNIEMDGSLIMLKRLK